MSKFPLIEKLGVRVNAYENQPGVYSYEVNAEELERVLERAPVVFGRLVTSARGMSWLDLPIEKIHQPTTITHTARLLMIEPIQKDTAEGLLREFTNQVDKDFGMSSPWQSLYERAKRLLEGK